MYKNFIKKSLIYGIIGLFIGANIVPTIMTESVILDSSGVETSQADVYYPSKDTYINEREPTVNFGSSSTLKVSNKYGVTSDYECDALLQFNLSAIPSGITLHSARLYLYYWDYNTTDPVGRNISCYRITQDWEEYSVTYNTKPDHYANVSSCATLPSDYGWVSWNVTADVQNFIDGEEINYGWWIMDENYWGYANIPQQDYRSKEGFHNHPYLEITILLVADAGGPYDGYTNTDIWFTGSASGGEPPYYFSWDLDNDGNYSDAYGEMVHHNYDVPGVYNISLEVRDNIYPWQYSHSTTQVTVRMDNPPNAPSKPSGPTNGKKGQEYAYTTSSIDPEGDQVYFFWEWGDGNNSGWIGPYTSGATCEAKHRWNVKNSYTIKVKAKDVFGVESIWSDPLPITMPYSYNQMHELLYWLFERFPNAFPLLHQVKGY